MRFSELDGQRIGLWGLGRETRSFARHLTERLPAARIDVVVLDDPAETVEGPGVDQATRVGPAEAVAALTSCDLVVRSPGVSIYRPEMQELAAAGMPAATPTGLWLAEHGPDRVIGVTGTKGKSTTATILHHLSRQLRPTHLAGNIGAPALDLLGIPEEDWVILELSSYQIADLRAGPAVAAITNLYPEHIQWHGSIERYRADKLALFATPGVSAAVFSPGNPQIEAAVAGVSYRVRFGTAEGWHLSARSDQVTPTIQRRDGQAIGLDSFFLRGRHNAENLCVALAALEAASLDIPALPAALADIPALPHRLQTVHFAANVEWIDDSISTTPESSLAALAAFPSGTVVLIAGGQDRQQDYRNLAAAVVARQEFLITLPHTGIRLASDARAAGIAPSRLIEAPDMESAVGAARAAARAGSIVLLSPAAPSYHAYTNFEARGDHFARLASDGAE